MIGKMLKKMFTPKTEEEIFSVDENRLKDKSNIYVAAVTKNNENNIPIQRILVKYKGLSNLQVNLVREPKNTYDKHAIKVYIDSDHIGYVPQSYSRKIASFIDRGLEVKGFIKTIREYEDEKGKRNLGCDLIIYTLE
jgi:hypothetical protein